MGNVICCHLCDEEYEEAYYLTPKERRKPPPTFYPIRTNTSGYQAQSLF